MELRPLEIPRSRPPLAGSLPRNVNFLDIHGKQKKASESYKRPRNAKDLLTQTLAFFLTRSY